MARAERGRELFAVLRDLGWKALSLGLERGGRLIVTVAAAPVLGTRAFGVLVFATTATAILALAADLGLGVWTTRTLARGDGDARDVVTVGLTLRGLAMAPYAVGVALIARFAAQGDAQVAVVLLGIAAAFNAFSDHFGAIFRGSARFAEETRLNATRGALTMGGGLSALAVRPSLVWLCGALAAASVGTFLQGLVGALRGGRRSGDATPGRRLAVTALRESWPIWVAGLLSMLYFKVDTFFVRSLAGDAELGTYGAAYKLFEGALLLPTVVLAATFPRLARLRDDVPAQRALERRVGSALLAVGLLVGAVCHFGRTEIVLHIFGAGFQRAEESLGMLALGIPLVYVNAALTHFLIARDLERVNLWLALMMLVVTVTLDILLIPNGGGPGAALATVLAEVALTMCCLGALALRRGAARAPPGARGASRTGRTPA
jgi:O-antigen/teichoic acid export membrane protein